MQPADFKWERVIVEQVHGPMDPVQQRPKCGTSCKELGQASAPGNLAAW